MLVLWLGYDRRDRSAAVKLSPEQHAAFLKATSDFRSDHEKALTGIREMFKIPKERFFGVRADGTVFIDYSRKREVESKKISKSDQE